MAIKGKRYGKTEEESGAEETLRCRQIVRTVMDFGVSESQKLKLIGLLALELENRDHLQQISTLIKRLQEGDSRKSTLIVE